MWKNRKLGEPASQSQPTSQASDPGHFLRDLDPRHEEYACNMVDRLLNRALELQASDIHLDPTGGSLRLRYRVDGVLLDLGTVADGQTTSITNRLKGLGKLLTYRADIPQEGRLTIHGTNIEARVVTLPTLHGERIVIRLAAQSGKAWYPADVGLPPLILQRLQDSLSDSSGVLLFAGPAGSGKTTSAYACLRAISSHSSRTRSIVSLEDPVEIEIPQVAQSQIQPTVGYDWASGLKAILRQDPEVILIGEIRDSETAQTAFQASMTGQLVISTMHAWGVCAGLRRLLDMRVPKHQICSGLRLIVCQRLVRKLCDCRAPIDSAVPSSNPPAWVDSFMPVGCDRCGYSGYRGRVLIAESLPELNERLVRAIHDEVDTDQLQYLAMQLGMQTLSQSASQMLAIGVTTSHELQRF